MEKKYKFPMGTKEVSEIRECSLRVVQLHCKMLNIPRAGRAFVILDQETLNKLMDNIHDHSGRPVVDKE